MDTPIPREPLPDFLHRIANNFERIAVRDDVRGRYGSYWLSELPEEKQVAHITRWLQERVNPLAPHDRTEEER
jgi:DNA-binding IscR family transcriptional regulator